MYMIFSGKNISINDLLAALLLLIIRLSRIVYMLSRSNMTTVVTDTPSEGPQGDDGRCDRRTNFWMSDDGSCKF